MEGWIKLHRKILDNPVVMKDSAHFAVWAYLLLNATHAEHPALFKGQRIMLQPGQLITGSISIAEKLKLNESKVRRVLNDFQNDGQIDKQTSNKNSLISVINWDLYQKSDGQIDVQVTDNRQTSDEQVADNRQTTGRQLTTNKNERKGESKNVKYKNEENEESNKGKNIYPSKDGLSDGKSDVTPFPLEDALLAAKDVAEKKEFPPKLQEAFTRWVKHKYSIGNGFKNAHAIFKVGSSVESNSKSHYNNRFDERLCNCVIKMIDYCISIKSKNLCWSILYEFD